MAGYVRQSIANIINGEDITAGPLNAEFNAIASSMNGTSGHTHDGGVGNGPRINLATSIQGYLPLANGGTGGRSNYSANVDPTIADNNTQGYVAGSIWFNSFASKAFILLNTTTSNAQWVQLPIVIDGGVNTKSNNAVDLGSVTNKFKNAYLAGTMFATSLGATQLVGTLDAGSNKIINLGNPSFNTDAANKAYVDQKIAELVASAPGVLDTLAELAAAIGNDPNFATTITNSIATKLPLAGGTMSGGINMGNNRITALQAPVNAMDAVNKDYIDTLFGSTVSAATSAAMAENARQYAMEWANKPEGQTVSTAAGGNGVTDYSAYHYSRQSALFLTTTRQFRDETILLTDRAEAAANRSEAADMSLIKPRLDSAGINTGVPQVTDANNAPVGTFTAWNGTEVQAIAANFPSLGGVSTTSRWFNLVTVGLTNRTSQTATEVYGLGTTKGRTFVRTKHDSTWHPWVETATLSSPAFTGTPTAPTAAAGNNTTQVSTTAFVTTAVNNAITTLRGGVASGFDTLKKLYDRIEAHVSATGNVHGATPAQIGAVDKTGDTMTGTLSNVNGNFRLVRNNKERQLYYDGGDAFGILGNDGNFDFWVTDAGHVWTAQFGDLNTRIENRAAAYADGRIAKTGDTMSGTLTLADVNLRMTRGANQRLLYNDGTWMGFLGNDGAWDFRVNDAGAVWTAQFGDLNTHINDQAAAYANGRVAKTGDTMTGPLIVADSVRSRAPGGGNAHVWFENSNGTERGVMFAGADNILRFRSGGGPSTSIGTDGNWVFNVNGIGQFSLTDLRYWATRGEEARASSLRDLRQVDAGTIGVPGPGQDYQWNYAPYGSFFRGVRKSNTAAPDAFHCHYIQGYSDARGWFTIG